LDGSARFSYFPDTLRAIWQPGLRDAADHDKFAQSIRQPNKPLTRHNILIGVFVNLMSFIDHRSDRVNIGILWKVLEDRSDALIRMTNFETVIAS
jgi:hypothetical protein